MGRVLSRFHPNSIAVHCNLNKIQTHSNKNIIAIIFVPLTQVNGNTY
jgi:hypothetical protein